MSKFLGTLAIAAGLALAPASAHALTTIDFETFTSGTSVTLSGVTFTAAGQVISRETTPNGTLGTLVGDTNRSPITATFGSAVSFVSVDLGDYGVDPDGLFLEVYDAGNNLLGSTSLLIDGTDGTMHTLSMSIAGISSAIFGSRSPSFNGSSVYADNFSFDGGQSGVPEPATWAMMILGMGAIGAAMRRRNVTVRYA